MNFATSRFCRLHSLPDKEEEVVDCFDDAVWLRMDSKYRFEFANRHDSFDGMDFDNTVILDSGYEADGSWYRIFCEVAAWDDGHACSDWAADELENDCGEDGADADTADGVWAPDTDCVQTENRFRNGTGDLFDEVYDAGAANKQLTDEAASAREKAYKQPSRQDSGKESADAAQKSKRPQSLLEEYEISCLVNRYVKAPAPAVALACWLIHIKGVSVRRVADSGLLLPSQVQTVARWSRRHTELFCEINRLSDVLCSGLPFSEAAVFLSNEQPLLDCFTVEPAESPAELSRREGQWAAHRKIMVRAVAAGLKTYQILKLIPADDEEWPLRVRQFFEQKQICCLYESVALLNEADADVAVCIKQIILRYRDEINRIDAARHE